MGLPVSKSVFRPQRMEVHPLSACWAPSADRSMSCVMSGLTSGPIRVISNTTVVPTVPESLPLVQERRLFG